MISKVQKFVLAFAVCAMLALSGSTAFAQTAVTLDDIGVDVEGVATAVGTGLGAIIATCLTVAGAILLVKYGWRWVKRATA